jgi:hypothetical protein
MQLLDTFDLVVNLIVLVMMPIIIWANLKLSGGLQDYLWREHPDLMRASLVFLGLLVVYAATEVLGHFGFASAETVEVSAIVIGMPMLALSLAIFWLGGAAALKALRVWRSG